MATNLSLDEHVAALVASGKVLREAIDGAAEEATATFTGTAVQLYLGLWNRSEELTVGGRGELLHRWRDGVRVGWR